jgi:hypothetical protein
MLLNRIRNRGKLKAIDIVPPQHTDLKNVLKRAELKYIMGYDVVEGTAFFFIRKLISDDDSEGGDSASDED